MCEAIRVRRQTLQSLWGSAFASGANTGQLVQEPEGSLDHQHPKEKRQVILIMCECISEYTSSSVCASVSRRTPEVGIVTIIIMIMIILIIIITIVMIILIMIMIIIMIMLIVLILLLIIMIILQSMV